MNTLKKASCGVPQRLGFLLAVVLLTIPGFAACAADAPPFGLSSEEAPSSAIWLDSLDVRDVKQEWGEPRAGRSVGRNPMHLGGIEYVHGLGTHAFSECHIRLDGACSRFVAMVGLDDEVGPNGSVVFEVWLDGSLEWKSPVLRGGDTPVLVDVGLEGATTLSLVVDPTDDGIHLDHADWAGALLFVNDNAAAQPHIVAQPAVEPPRIAQEQQDAPRINAPRAVSATPGRPFDFRIPCAGELPLRFAIEGLPGGLVLEPETGIMTGVIQETGVFEVELRAANKRGQNDYRMLLVAAPDCLALTPPRGWNSWNVWGETIDSGKVRAAADALLSTRIADYGFQYVCIDDGWAGGRDEFGAIIPNDKLPDMSELVAYLHEKGLKAGIYTSPGRTTCAGYEGSYEHELQDAHTFAAWGMDFLKYDWCSYGGVAEGEGREMYVHPYRIMREGLDACGRDIVYAVCQYGAGNVWEWASSPDVRANQWRTTEDITDSWSSMLHNALATAAVASFARPGHWNDADMMVLGTLGWGRELRETRLNPREQQTHVTLWTLLPSPMFLGCDVTQLDAFTLALLRNPEVAAVHQDPLGVPVRCIAKSEDKSAQVWIRKLWDETYAVGFFNFARRGEPRDIQVSWAELGATEDLQAVRDLWQRKELGEHGEGIVLAIPAHGCALLKVGTPISNAAAMDRLRRRYEGYVRSTD